MADVSSQRTRTPVFLLTGFLGSGKTTVLNALLKAPAFANTAVIVNEFGEIGLDHFLIEGSKDNVVLLEAGCLCCTISDSMHETMADLHARRIRGDIPEFTRLVIETTGLADPAPILNTLLGNRLVTDHYRFEAAIVTVDAQHVLDEIRSHAEVTRQIALADRVLLTKTDLVKSTHDVLDAVRQINMTAPIIPSTSGSEALTAFSPLLRNVTAKAAGSTAIVDGSVHDHDSHQVEHPLGEQHPHDVNRHDDHIRAHCLTIEDPASWAGVAAWWMLMTEHLGNRLLRCKGVLRIADTGEIVFIQGVQRVFHRPERLADWPDTDHRSRIVCIARDFDDAELLQTLPAFQLPAGTHPESALHDLQLRLAKL